MEEIKVLKGDISKNAAYAHPKFVEPMLDYIVKDFEKARITTNNIGIGGMVVCDSADQAKKMYEIFQNNYANIDESSNDSFVEEGESYNAKRKKEGKVNTAALSCTILAPKMIAKNWLKLLKIKKK